MASVLRASRFGKIAALTAIGGSFYLLRHEIKPYLGIKDSTATNTGLSRTGDVAHQIEKPRYIENLPHKVPYLLIGAGTASHAAMRAIRGHDSKAKVLMIGAENRTPYMRPALSKELWYTEPETRRALNFKWWNGKEKSIFYEIDEFFIPIENLLSRETGGVSLVENIHVTRIDPDNRIAYLNNNQSIEYEKCLLATGGRPKTLSELDGVKERVIYYRTADDFLKLEKISTTAHKIIVIGGGLLGSELACALAKRHAEEKTPKEQEIYQIYPEAGNLGKLLPCYLSEYVSKKVKQEGTHLVPTVEVKSAHMTTNNQVEVKLSNGESILGDYIVCAVGLEPDVDLAAASGLEVDEKLGGYLVNSELESRTNVWVAGDASCFYDRKLGRRRVEHHDHAINSGRLAGQNMIGSGKAYNHQSMFWSDIGNDISFEAVGIIDSSLRTVAIFAKPGEIEPENTTNLNEESKQDSVNFLEASGETGSDNNTNDINKGDVNNDREARIPSEKDVYVRGVVFYLKDDIIVGVLLWNLFSRLNIARRILNEQRKYDDFNEVSKLFNLYLDE